MSVPRLPQRRVAAHTYAYRDQPIEVAVERIADLGFRAVEVWVGHATAGADYVARVVAASGMEAAAVSAGGFYDESASSARNAFELAHAIGAEIVVACVSPRAVPRLSSSIPDGMTLCIENHWDQVIRRPGDVVSVIAHAPTTRLAACLDTGHAILAGVRPERFAGGLGSSLAHIHLKDARRRSSLEVVLGTRLRRRLLPRPQPVIVGTGDLDVARFVVSLDGLGYRGWITVEDEGADADSALKALKGAVLRAPALRAADVHS
ncbi:MAG: sugar phosphate isomerase/epimerase family protein [Gaiellaceae bacterium]